ncbi:5'-3' exoribonuclease 4 [Nosema granulosis]|uniref:5'-3' exoribonuclease 4 n=1 Tax=Nosema granulosis TaxID=83296 RepID=A0A9P6GYS0_9MICR|nr:5'-3' exoribonuclease 4 [Nosema granulosis]
MGVPILFAWMNQKHSNCLKNTPPESVDNLYIDFNALIHNCYNPNLGSIEKIHSDMVDRLIATIDNLITRTKPKNILYIAVDGVAPGAKLAHQRGRRFKSACERHEEITIEAPTNSVETWDNVIVNNEEELMEKFEPEDEISIEDIPGTPSFDSNCISPGTELMEYLHEELLRVWQYKLSTDVKYKNLKIIYSSYLVPGEGEQKIVAFIRKYHPSNPKDVHVMYSPDGDVIFLGVGMLNVNFYIMREDTYNNINKKSTCGTCSKLGHTAFECGKPALYKFTYVDIPSFISVLCKDFALQIRGHFDKNRMLFDWILVCFMIGNDFIPGVPCLDIKTCSIESLTSLICRNFIKTREYLTRPDGNLNYHVLEVFLTSLSRLEDGYYVVKSRLLNRFSKETNREQIPLQTREGKLKYYNLKLHANNQDDIDNVCIEYITGMLWIFNYYIKGFTDWSWVYPFHFAPFASDLARVCRSSFKLKKGFPLSPFEQLLVLIPPQSKTLVPEKLRPLYDKYKSFFPTEVKIDMFDKYLPWAGVVMLPHMNFTPILRESRENINEMPVEVLKRNVTDSDLLIVNDKTIINTINRIYMNLKPFEKVLIGNLTVRTSSYHKSKFPEEELEYKDGSKFVNMSIISRIDKI